MINGTFFLYVRSMIWRAGLVGLWIVASFASQQIDQLTCAIWLCISLAHEGGLLGTNEVVPDAPDGGVPATTAAPGTNGTGTTDSDATTDVNEEADNRDGHNAAVEQSTHGTGDDAAPADTTAPGTSGTDGDAGEINSLSGAAIHPSSQNDHQEKTDDDVSDTASDCYTTVTEGPDTDVSDDESIDSARSVSSVF